ncbi:OpgC domain-containing protein [Clavibacter sp. Sh2088]|uniref:OpgC domain-containing protein n=1 Tax=Clavibacter sp. Sh2088 TaxID=3397676 RepID=UPI0039E0D8B0
MRARDGQGRGRGAPRIRRVLAAAGLVAAALLASAAAPASASVGPAVPAAADAAPARDLPAVLVPERGAYLGATLDWSRDSAAAQAERLGAPAAVYAHTGSVPMTDDESAYLRPFAQQAAAVGAIPVVTLEPAVPLAEVDDDVAAALADDLRAVLGSADAPAYVRFAPDMNVPWSAWGMQPDAYRAAFAAVAGAVHAELPGSAMVWSPSWGGSYPFGADRPASAADLRALDTSGDGALDAADDPYGPFLPAAGDVDAVGLSVFHDDSPAGRVAMTLPVDGELAARLGPADTPPGGAAPDDFVARFSTPDATPLLLETAALTVADADPGGPAALDVQRAWWRQVMAAAGDDAYPTLAAVLWADTSTTRDGVPIRWGVSDEPDVAAAFAADLADSALVAGPVLDPVALPAAASGPGVIPAGWSVVVAVLALLAAAGLYVLATRPRIRARLAYDEPGRRDLRIDMMRGVAIVFVVVNHVGLVSAFQTITQEGVGVVSGAELFVLLSGVVLGLVHRPAMEAGGIREVAGRTTRRAVKLYVTALVVVVVVLLLSRIPGVDGTVVTTFTDEGTGAAGAGAAGTVYDLYAGSDRLLTYPASVPALFDLLLLKVGPWQFNIMGLYVVLLAVSPLVLLLLVRRLWPVALGISVALHVVGALAPARLLPSQFEDSFPLLSWQLLFVVGMVVGYHRRSIVAWWSSRAGRVALPVCVLLAVLLALFAWSNPYLADPLDVRLALLPDATYQQVYDAWFQRTRIEPGRLLDVLLVVVVGYAALTAFWRPIHRALGWFLVPLGQATLYVFVMHVLLALVVANVPGLASGGVVVGTLAYVVILGLLWVMVRTRFLFRLVPR